MALCIEKLYPELKEADVLVPVPQHVDELKQDKKTGAKYNQSLELAKVIASETGMGVEEALVKAQPHSQRGKDWYERVSLPASLYVHNQKFKVKGKSILLVDDVRTSGATSSACAKELYSHEALKVNLFVAGRDVLRDWKPPRRSRK